MIVDSHNNDWFCTYNTFFAFLLGAINVNTEPIFKRLKLLKVSDILIMHELKFYYKFIHEKLRSYLQNLPLYANTNTHNYATRTNQNVHLEFIPNHEYAKMCVRYQVPNIVHSTATNIIKKIHTHSLKGFTGYIKLITLQLFQENCHMENCYICSRS